MMPGQMWNWHATDGWSWHEISRNARHKMASHILQFILFCHDDTARNALAFGTFYSKWLRLCCRELQVWKAPKRGYFWIYLQFWAHTIILFSVTGVFQPNNRLIVVINAKFIYKCLSHRDHLTYIFLKTTIIIIHV